MKKEFLNNYCTPSLRTIEVCLERGFSATDNFEQPGYGGEEDIK